MANANVRPTVTFPAAGHYLTLSGTKLYCLVTANNVKKANNSHFPASDIIQWSTAMHGGVLTHSPFNLEAAVKISP